MIQVIQIKDYTAWDNYLSRHSKSNFYQGSNWQSIIAKTYAFKTFSLAAVQSNTPPSEAPTVWKMVGLLPLVYLKSPFIGNRLVSMPYFDHGGITADNSDYEKQLLHAAVALGQKLKAQHIELRQLAKIEFLQNESTVNNQGDCSSGGLLVEPLLATNRAPFRVRWSLRSHKVRLLLSLPDSAEALMRSFKSKLRSQINRPIKAGLVAKIGGMELIDDFYKVFCINMRDLGSPVHAKSLPQSVMAHFAGNARIAAVYNANEPIAAALMVGCNNVMINPWASALREHSKYSPNMLLYWAMLAYAADHGFHQFDFGRSTPEEGTYRFKTQWGAQPHPMYWYTIWLNRNKTANAKKEIASESTKRKIAVTIWQKLPISITRIIGPHIRKHIEL